MSRPPETPDGSAPEVEAPGRPEERGAISAEALPAPPTSPESPADAPATSRPAWDVAVVGAGLAGLAVAALLARAGCAVVVLEQASEIGGMCRPLRLDGVACDPGLEFLVGFAEGGPGRRLLGRLGLELPLTMADPALQIALPRHRLSLPADPEGWWPEIRREFPTEEGGWQSLLEELGKLAAERETALQRLPPLPPEGWRQRLQAWRVLSLGSEALRRIAATPFRTALTRHRLGPDSQQALEAVVSVLDFRDAGELGTLEAASLFQWLRAGVARLPEGGLGLARALSANLEKAGGMLRLAVPVDRCLVERGRVAGVVTGTGEIVRAGTVIAAVPPPILLGKLLPTSGRWLRRRREAPACVASRVAEMLVGRLPEAYLPSELATDCVVVLDARRPGRAGSPVRLHVAPAGEESGEMRRLVLSRLRPPGDTPGPASLLAALEQVCPGAASVMAGSADVPAEALAEHWGRPGGAARYGFTCGEWLGRRGLPHRLGWRGLWAVGEATYPGGLLPDVIEGAMQVADRVVRES